MKQLIFAAATVLLAAPAWAAGPITGDYVEARTAEVFAGGCIMSSEAETIGKQAVLAWRVESGEWDGQRLDGLAVVAAVSGDRNLGIREIGGEAPSYVKGAVFVDDRASAAQLEALISLAQTLSKGLITEVVAVEPTPIRFDTTSHQVVVQAGEAELAVDRHVAHAPGCGAMKWFTPFSSVDRPVLGRAAEHSFSGSALGTRWSAPNRKSAFHGTFTIAPDPSLSN